MKKASKWFSALLALTLMLTLGSTAFAATGQIFVADPGTYTYTAYKIFDAATSASGTDVTYTIDAASEWLDVVYDTTNNTSKIAGLTFTPDADPATEYTVTWGAGFDSAALAGELKGNIPTGATAIAFTSDTSGVHTDANLDPGYYLVISEDAGTAQVKAALTTVLEDKKVVIQNKNDMPFDKTVDDVKVEGVQVGDVLNFKLEGKVPTVDAADTFYTYLISDKMDAGLTFNDDLVVKIDGTQVSLTEIGVADAVLTGDQVRYGQNGKTFEISLDMLTRGKDASLQGKTIEITYTATVNQNAVSVISENNAVLQYGNDPSNLTIKDSQTKVYTSQIIIDKYENGAPEQKLQGAEFVLYKREAGQASAPATGDYDAETVGGTTTYYPRKYYKYDAATVTWVDAQADATKMVTDENGKATFTGLEDGTYYLLETKAPAGYTLVPGSIPVEVDGSQAITPGMDEGQVAQILTNVANVANTPGTTLPSTGGVGTTIFYLVGAVLILSAAVLLILRKRAQSRN